MSTPKKQKGIGKDVPMSSLVEAITNMTNQINLLDLRVSGMSLNLEDLNDNFVRLEDKVDKKFTEFREYVDIRFDSLDERVDGVELTVGGLARKIDRIDQRFNLFEQNVATKYELQALSMRVDDLEEK